MKKSRAARSLTPDGLLESISRLLQNSLNILVDRCVKAGKAQEARQLFAWTLEMEDLPDAYRTCIAVRRNSLPPSETKH